LNRACDVETAQLISENYAEVVLAPEFEDGVMAIFSKKKNLRVMRISNIQKLQDFAVERFVDFKSLIDGGLVAQWSFQPQVRDPQALLPAVVEYKGETYKVNREPTAQEQDDMIFVWLVEAGVTSNSVLYVKDGVTVGIGTGEQDRVGVAQIARDKAYTKLADRLCWEQHGTPFNMLKDEKDRATISEAVKAQNGGLTGACMVSDAFFPFRDGIDVGLAEGVTAVVQPGGSLRDYEVIQACNEYNAAMCFTGQRSFKH
jgi:phosphoribosylaminoimidazolecarboxamide formyltransferase/IMP cyclohydrolase